MSDNLLQADDFCMEPLLDYQRLQAILDESGDSYRNAEPFPHIVIDDFITPEAVDMLLADFPMPQDRINHDDASQWNRRPISKTLAVHGNQGGYQYSQTLLGAEFC